MYRISILFIFLLILSKGQEKSYPKIDSALSKIAVNSLNSFDFKKGIAETKKLIKKSEQLNYKKGIGLGNLNIANFLTNSGYYRESLHYLEISEKNINETDYYTLSAMYNEYGKVYGFLNLHQTALGYFDKAIVASKKIENKKLQKMGLQMSYACKAESSKFLSRYDSMYVYFKKAYKLDPDPITGSNIANYFTNYKKDQIDSADYYLKIATQALQKKTYDPLNKLGVLMEYGDYYFQKHQYDKALEKQLESESLAIQMKRVDERASIYKRISKTYFKLNDEKKSIEFLEKYTALSDSLKTVNDIALNISVDKLVKDKENEKVELKTRNLYIVITIFILALLVTITGYVLYIRKKKEKELLIQSQKEEINQKEIEKRNLEHKVNDAFEEVVKLAKDNNPSFFARFKEVYPEFCNKILTLYPDILNSELIFCAYLKLNLSSKEIANYTFVTQKAIQTCKSRIRKKFNIPLPMTIYMFGSIK